MSRRRSLLGRLGFRSRPEGGGQVVVYLAQRFPQTSYSAQSRRFWHWGIPPDPEAPLCPPSSIDTSPWQEVRHALGARRGATLSLRLPPHFHPMPYSEMIPAGRWPFWGLRCAWWIPPWSRVAEERLGHGQLVIWLGPVKSYPDLGVDAETTQSSVQECQCEVAGRRMSLVSFVLEGPCLGKTYHVAALWKVSHGVWLQASGYGEEASRQAEMIAALQSVHFQSTTPG